MIDAYGVPIQGYGLGGLLKRLGGPMAGILGFAALGPAGAALSSGLYTGLKEKNYKKGILSGLASYVGGKAFSDLGKSATAALTDPASGQISSQVSSSGIPMLARRTADATTGETLRHLGSRAGLDSVAKSLGSPSNVAFVYPQMSNMATALGQEARASQGTYDPYDDELRAAQERYRRNFGSNPWSNMYARSRGYADGGQIYDDAMMVFGDPISQESLDDWNNEQNDRGDTPEDPNIWDTAAGPNNPWGPDDWYISDAGSTPITRPIIDEWNNEQNDRGDTEDDYGRDTNTTSSGGSGGSTGGGGSDDGQGDGTGSMPSWFKRYARGTESWFAPGYMPEWDYYAGNAKRGIDNNRQGFEELMVGQNPFDTSYLDEYLDVNKLLSGVSQMADGGQVQQQGDELVQAAIAVIMGQVADERARDEIIQAFIEAYGAEAFDQLRKQVMESVSPGSINSGLISNQQPSGGMSDNMMTSVPGSNPVAVSPGEFIVPADVVSMLGDGDTASGAQALEDMMARVRMEKTGTSDQAPPLRQGGILPR